MEYYPAMRNKCDFRQQGQGMVEFTIVLVFGVMVMTIGPGGDVLLDLLGVMNDKYQGYSYATSISEMPQYDTIGEYVAVVGSDYVDPAALIGEIGSYASFPTTMESFPDDLVPTTPAEISSYLLDGASSFF
jgi:hypothetical protein